MQTTDVLIVGAGISGLLCATELQRGGLSVRVLDKGRGLGGRMATRRMAGGRFDHGAQFFTVRDPRFQAYVDRWLEAGIIKQWFRHGPQDDDSDGHPRYCGIHGMTDVPKFLAASLEVQNSEQVVELIRDSGIWVARTTSGNAFTARHLVVAAPLPQALDLLDTTGLNYAGGQEAALRSVRYEKGLATLAILEGPSGLPHFGALKMLHAPLAWVGDNQQKGISPAVSAITIHADPEFAEAHWDSDDSVRGPLMLEAVKLYLNARVVEYSCHRWGFAQAVNPRSEPFFSNMGLQLTLAGDGFGAPRIEGAALSGIEAAQGILGSFAMCRPRVFQTSESLSFWQ